MFLEQVNMLQVDVVSESVRQKVLHRIGHQEIQMCRCTNERLGNTVAVSWPYRLVGFTGKDGRLFIRDVTNARAGMISALINDMKGNPKR